MPYKDKQIQKKNPFLEELKKLQGKNVIVEYFDGKHKRKDEGEVLFIDFASKTLMIKLKINGRKKFYKNYLNFEEE